MNQRGFTLIELLIAIAMIGILAATAVAIINPLEQIKKGRDAQRKNDLIQIRNALDAYNSDNNRYPAANDQQINDAHWGDPWPPYMVKVPKDPLAGQSYSYQVAEDGSWFRLYATLERCNDQQIIPGSNCSSNNYLVSSTNIALPTPIPTSTPAPTPTPGPKYVFITSATYNGNLGGLTGADTKCKTLADNSSITSIRGRTWAAWLSDSANSPAQPSAQRPFTHATVPYNLVDGTTIIASSWTDLITNKNGNYLTNPISKDESGNVVSGNMWTSTAPIGDNSCGSCSSRNCSNWTSGSNPSIGVKGYTPSTTSSWTTSAGEYCDSNFLHLYCFEQ